MKVPIDYRACTDVEGETTDIWFDVSEFFVGLSVLLGSTWIVENRRAFRELGATLHGCPRAYLN